MLTEKQIAMARGTEQRSLASRIVGLLWILVGVPVAWIYGGVAGAFGFILISVGLSLLRFAAHGFPGGFALSLPFFGLAAYLIIYWT